MKLRSYSELIKLKTFEDRFLYLKLNDKIGIQTFGFDRIVNQKFYRSKEWKDLRNYVIDRDSARDLGIEGRDVFKYIYIHHMNPISLDDLQHSSDIVWNPEYLICCSRETHNAIHYGDYKSLKSFAFEERRPGDTKLW